MGSQNSLLPPLDVLRQALNGGITMFQLREKGENALTGDQYIQFARQCQLLCREYQIPFIVNDDIELALLLDADGVHIGQDDQLLQEVRKRLPHKIIGISVHTIPEYELAIKQGADYVGIGPIFPTISKVDAKDAAGTNFLLQAVQHPQALPIVAIGGITLQNIHTISESGADGIAVISAISQAASPFETAKKFLSHFR